MPKALVLISGGLDSMLVAKMLAKQGIDVTLLCFESYFFSGKGAKKAASALGLPLRIVDISKEQLEIVRHPRYGRGSSYNPCIDCHLLMLKTAKKILDAEDFDFVATGEVLGQRPMSQNRQSLDLIERESGLIGKLLRPLSARLLPETEPEKRGLVDRAQLGAISGRERQIQYELAKQFGIVNIPQPAGGCILTDPEFGRKLSKLFEIKPGADGEDVMVLRQGRVFYDDKTLIVVARDQEESKALPGFKKPGDIIALPENFPGPTVLVRDLLGNTSLTKLEALAKNYLLRFSKKAPKEPQISVKTMT